MEMNTIGWNMNSNLINEHKMTYMDEFAHGLATISILISAWMLSQARKYKYIIDEKSFLCFFKDITDSVLYQEKYQSSY
jgi:hypothetical protein